MQKRLTLVALAAIWVLQVHDAVAGPGRRVFELDRDLRQLDRKFHEAFRKFFYVPEAVAVREDSFFLLDLAIEVALSDAIVYAHQRRGLQAAREVINKYFVARRAPLNPVLVPDSDLVELIIQRAVAESIKRGLQAIEGRRKRIYLLEQRHADHPRVLTLARLFARSLMTLEVKETNARLDFQVLLGKYKEYVPFLWSAAHESEVTSAIDQLIQEAAADGDLNEDALLRRYSKSTVLVDLFVAQDRWKGQFEIWPADEISAVRMKDITVYEDQITQQTEGIGAYLKDLEWKLVQMDEFFEQVIDEVFYEPQNMGVTKNNYALHAVTSFMADCEALMYAEERRMLVVLRDLVEQQQSDVFQRLYELDKNLIYVIENRLLLFTVESIIARASDRKKKLILMLKRYDTVDGVRDLAREHLARINGRRRQLADIQMTLHLYLQDIWGALPERKQMVDQVVQEGIETWTAGLDDGHLLNSALDPTLFKDLVDTRKKSFKKIYRPSMSAIEAVTARDIAMYEGGLFGIDISDSE